MSIETLWIDEKDFVKYVQDAGDRATLEGIDGFTRWVVTGEDGIRYMVRPKVNDEHQNTTEDIG